MLNIGGLNEGFVLDHIEAGKAMMIYNNLGLDKLDCCVAIIKNARSNKMGKKDILKIDKSINNKKSVKSKKSVTVRDIENINFEILYNVVWVLAKTADKSIPEPMTWYDTFEDFDISEVFTELQDLILRSISPNSKKK